MRIISGKYKIRQIAAPKNFTARPTTDFAKENIFNVLNNYYDFEGLTALDLFAGTGSLSYEFASRGCASVTTVEMNSDHFRFILSVIKQLNISEIIPVRMDVFRFIEKCNDKFDLIFADPPYDLKAIETIPDKIFASELLAEKGMLILEHSDRSSFKSHPRFIQHKAYGSVNFSLFE